MKIQGTHTDGIKIRAISRSQYNPLSNEILDKKLEKDSFHPSVKETSSLVEKANSILFKNNTRLKFDINSESEKVIVRIIDDETGEVLKEIPDEDFVEMMHKLCEIAGIFVDERC